MDFPFQSAADARPRARVRQGLGSRRTGCWRARSIVPLSARSRTGQILPAMRWRRCCHEIALPYPQFRLIVQPTIG